MNKREYVTNKGYEDAKECQIAGGAVENISFGCSYKNNVHQQFYKEGWFKYWGEFETRKLNIASHELYTEADFTEEEAERGGMLYVAVVEGGLSVCKRCGEYEAGLDNKCK